MIAITVTADSATATAFLVRVEGELRRPRALNDRLARALTRKLQAHFKDRQGEPNKMAARKSGFWAGVCSATMVGEVSDAGATVRVGVDSFFRIHLLGGTIRPTGGRKFLTIPLIPAARGLRAADYEKESGRKLFRPGYRRVLMERSGEGDRSFTGEERSVLRTKGGYRVFNLGARARVRPVYALATSATIPKDPRALPPGTELAAALQEAASQWAAREMAKGGKTP